VYNWLLFGHIVAVAGFLLAHGTSAGMAFRLRSEKTTDGIRLLTQLSKQTTAVMYSFILIFITGLLLGIQGGWFGRYWIWTAMVVLIVTIGVMSFLRRLYNTVRASVGLPTRSGRGTVTSTPGSPEDIRRAVDATPAGLITAIGVVALALLLWLIIMKPF
jgi:phosphoglycerol transferase MdoB-like AlkP superfamily enzyme